MNKSFISLLKENWVIILVVGQFVISMLALQGGFTDHEKRIEKLEDSRVKEALNIAEINSRLSSIETSLIFIRESLRQ